MKFFDILCKENTQEETDKVRKDLLEDKAGIKIMEYRGMERVISYVPVKKCRRLVCSFSNSSFSSRKSFK